MQFVLLIVRKTN